MSSPTPNMGLITWDLLADPYDHNQLAANFVQIDLHDHDPDNAGGVQVDTPGIADEAVTTPKLGDGAVTTSKIANNAVTAPKMDRQYVHPLGKIMQWWRPNTLTAVPSGWVIPIGQTLSSSEHDFPGGGSIILPNLTNRFLLGGYTSATDTGNGLPPTIGATGGSHIKDLTHTHVVEPHSHTVNAHSHVVNSHTHTVDDHIHGVPPHQHRHTYPFSRKSGGTVNLYALDPTSVESINSDGYGTNASADVVLNASLNAMVELVNATGIANTTRYMVRSGPGILEGTDTPATQTLAAGSTTGPSSPGTDTASPGTDARSPNTGTPVPSFSSVNVVPAYVGVLSLMKVRDI